MRYKVYIVLLSAVAVAAAIAALCGVGGGWIAGLCVAIVVLTLLLSRSVIVPMNAVRNGMYLLREQDFGSRLRKTGQPDADNVVELYNSLIDSMKAERLKNLEQNRFLSLLVDASPLGIAVCDFDGNIVQTNRAWERMQSPPLAKAIAEVADGETRTIRAAEALIVRISRLWFMDMGFRRRFILVEKLTEEIAAAEKQMFNTIVRTIGHEVNNSLGSVMSVLDTLAEMHAGDALISEAIGSSRTSCANLVNFVRGYADIVKLPAPVFEQVDLNAWLGHTAPSLEALAAGFGASLSVVPDRGDACSKIDPMLMERVLVNLVKNAAESIAARGKSDTDAPGRITVTLSRDAIPGTPGCLRLTVTDNGRGIDPETAARLFTPFFSTKNPDRGLGLMLVADILRAHRSRFALATDADTGLTSFTLTLP